MTAQRCSIPLARRIARASRARRDTATRSTRSRRRRRPAPPGSIPLPRPWPLRPAPRLPSAATSARRRARAGRVGSGRPAAREGRVDPGPGRPGSARRVGTTAAIAEPRGQSLREGMQALVRFVPRGAAASRLTKFEAGVQCTRDPILEARGPIWPIRGLSQSLVIELVELLMNSCDAGLRASSTRDALLATRRASRARAAGAVLLSAAERCSPP